MPEACARPKVIVAAAAGAVCVALGPVLRSCAINRAAQWGFEFAVTSEQTCIKTAPELVVYRAQ